MDLIVQARWSRKEHFFLLNPMGTFKGHGGFIGISPMVSISRGDERLGDIVVELLERSGPTGFHIREHFKYRSEIEDAKSRKLREFYIPKSATTGSLSKRFVRLEISTTRAAKSWKLTRFEYDKLKKASFGVEQERIRFFDGTETLRERMLSIVGE
ncbi:MAG: hypothetical protein AAFU77_18085 [Myxococcota bacterium]